MSDKEEEDELIRLSEIFETLKKDAIEVSDLLVKGIEFYNLLAYFCIAVGFFVAWNFVRYLNLGDVLWSVVWGFFTALFFLMVPYGFYKNRQLKKKYKELIDIHKSLTEE